MSTPTKSVAGQKTDPFTVAIIRSGLVATTDEMKTNLMRTAYNTAIYEALDFTVAVTDAEGNLASIGLGLPSFIRGISDTVKAMLKYFGEDIEPGDVLFTNDSYTHGSHLNHVIAAFPIFHDGEIVAFSCSEPHWIDIGGVLGGSTSDIYSEGLQLPFLKIYKRGELNKDVVDIIRVNVRNPDLAMGDFRGQIACARTGEKRILHMVEKYGVSSFKESLRLIMDNAAEFSRREIAKIPEGTYEAEQFMDDDGVDIGAKIPIKVKVIVKGDTMTVDLSGVGRQVRGYYNSGAGVTGVQMGFKTVICPTWYPVNDGSFRPLKVVVPPGTVVSAQRPAAMRWWMTIPSTIADTMWMALAQAVPEKISAGHHADLLGAISYEIDPQTRRPMLRRVQMGLGPGGGWGAKYNADGMCATIMLNDGDTHNHPFEAAEAHNPSAIALRLQLDTDSGGAGKNRGGLGKIGEMLYLQDALFSSYVERTMCAPWGAEGGKPGRPNRIALMIAKEKLGATDLNSSKALNIAVERREYPNPSQPNAKVVNVQVPAGSRLLVMAGGGGGFGSPLERDPQRVLDDVINGYVSLEAAEREYGVVIDRARMTVKEAETRSLREKS